MLNISNNMAPVTVGSSSPTRSEAEGAEVTEVWGVVILYVEAVDEGEASLGVGELREIGIHVERL
jgi:hypothetical protein